MNSKLLTGWPLAVALLISMSSSLSAQSDGAVLIEEIIVTAQYREQSLQDVSAGIQAFQGDDLDRNGANSFLDYALSVPSLSFRDQGSGSKRLAIRGVSNASASDLAISATVATTGLYINDVAMQGTSIMPDVAIYDLDRIEVLKGPQGTLYGEGAMGGAVRMILNRPDPSAFEIKTDISFGSVEEGEMDYHLKGAINMPLVEDKIALRLVGTYSDLGGFVDNVGTGASDFNTTESYSVRVNLAAQVTEKVDLDLLYMRNDQELNGFPYIDVTLSDLEYGFKEPLTSEYVTDVTALTITADLGFAQLTSVSSLFRFERDNDLHFVLTSGLFGVEQDRAIITADLESLAQEIRLVSQGDGRLDWVFGAYYRDKEQPAQAWAPIAPEEVDVANAWMASVGFGPPIPANRIIFDRVFEDIYEQTAVYGEVSYEFTDRLRGTVGARWYDEDVTGSSAFTFWSWLAPFSSPDIDINSINNSDVVPMVSFSYDISDDQMVYFRYAEGYRSGLINIQALDPVNPLGTIAVESDDSNNFEVGIKTLWNDGRTMFNASAYLIDWEGIQTQLVGFSEILGSNIGYLANGPDARLIGGEFELVVSADQVTFGGALGYTDSEITDAAPPILGNEVLPNVPEITASAFVDVSWPVLADAMASVHANLRYQDEQATRLITEAVSDGAPVGSYTILNLRVGIDWEKWGIQLFVNNLTDERAELGLGQGSISNFDFPNVRTVNRPRTFGVALRTRF